MPSCLRRAMSLSKATFCSGVSMHDVIEHMLARRHRGRGHHIGHQINAEIATPVGELLQNFVRLIARMSVDGGASSVRDQDGLFRFSYAFRSRAVAAVTQIDRNPEIVHLFDGGDACLAEACVAGLEAPIAEDAAVIVGELHDANAEPAEHVDAIGILFEKRCVLKTEHDADFVFALGTGDIRVAAHD